MRALRSFTVQTHLPEELAPLRELAMNLRWSWDVRTRELFRSIDPRAWKASHSDPLAVLASVSPERLDELAADRSFMTFMGEVYDTLKRSTGRDRWFQQRGSSPLRNVAYFSAEFGIAAALPQYSGGLGVLAGDHLKASSGVGIPLTGVGLFYKEGYFRQSLNTEGWQQERYPMLDPHAMSLTLSTGADGQPVRIHLDLAGEPLVAQVWKAQVGRIELYMLDTDLEENSAEGRLVTDRLYGGGTEHRIRQEILLGVGGVRALEAVGIDIQVFHMNEGHAGFVGLERIRRFVTEHDMTLPEAVEAARSATIFTTHTPVPAGIDRFQKSLMVKYWSGWCAETGVPFEQLMALGAEPTGGDMFNMAMMGLRLAGMANGVSKLHGKVSQKMFNDLWPSVPWDEVPIGSVTNGVHGFTWVGSEMADLLSRNLIPSWPEADQKIWNKIQDVPDDELWRAREMARGRLVTYVRGKMAEQERARGRMDTEWTDRVLDPRALTIGFARRFATYKRADLLLSHPERLAALLSNPERPVQLVFAGKAHPADDQGKALIQRIISFAIDHNVRDRIAFMEDYDITVAAHMYQGADVWLNNPRRPMEACGTSGEKAALNGALNLSILDGWWDEWYDGKNGWAITSAEDELDLVRRDAMEAESLFNVLESQVVPLFYDRPRGMVPLGWTQRMKDSLDSLGPKVEAYRMVRDYTEQYYEPTARATDALSASGYRRARELAAWKTKVVGAWDQIKVVSVEGDLGTTTLRDERVVDATVAIDGLRPSDVIVQVLHGPVAQGDELVDPLVTDAEMVEARGDGTYLWRAKFSCNTAGRYGFTARVLPRHDDLLVPESLARITWA